jgi:hypothetical protein
LITRAWVCGLIFALSALAAAAPATDEVTLRKDLTAVLMLLSLPCGQVTSATRQAQNDHVASCEDGNRYRIFVNPEGRVVAQKL